MSVKYLCWQILFNSKMTYRLPVCNSQDRLWMPTARLRNGWQWLKNVLTVPWHLCMSWLHPWNYTSLFTSTIGDRRSAEWHPSIPNCLWNPRHPTHSHGFSFSSPFSSTLNHPSHPLTYQDSHHCLWDPWEPQWSHTGLVNLSWVWWNCSNEPSLLMELWAFLTWPA